MSKLLRYYNTGNIYFVTSVTYQRNPILLDHADIFCKVIKRYQLQYGFDLIAWVILPDHFHLIIDPKDNNLSTILKSIKLSFAYRYRKLHSTYRQRVWQYRFWDHSIRDQNDMNRHIDYIHINAVKHGFVDNPAEWKHSSFKQYKSEGYYTDDWGDLRTMNLKGNYGE